MESNILDTFELELASQVSIVRFDGTSEYAVYLINNAVLLLLQAPRNLPEYIKLVMIAVNKPEQGKGNSRTVLNALCDFCDRHKKRLFAEAQLIKLRDDGKGFTKETSDELNRNLQKIGTPIGDFGKDLRWAMKLSKDYGFRREDLYLLREPKI